MKVRPKRNTSANPDAEALECAKVLKINVSAVAEVGLFKAIAEARYNERHAESVDALAAQANWHERTGHPLTDIIVTPGGSSWKDGSVMIIIARPTGCVRRD